MPLFELKRTFARNPPENFIEVRQTLKATRETGFRYGRIREQ